MKKAKNLYSKFPSLKKNEDNIKLLISYPEFQEEIKQVREYLNIPENGFKNGDNNGLEKWENEMAEISEKMMNDSGFQRQIKMIWQKQRRGEVGSAMARKQSYLVHDKIPINYFSNRCLFITDKFGLPENYSDFIRGYILDGRTTERTSNFSIMPFYKDKGGRTARHLTVKIYARLTDRDLADLKRQIDLVIKNKLPKYQELRNIDKKLNLEKWVENRIKHDEVNDIDYKMTNGEIAKNLFGSKEKAKKVNDTYRSIKKLRESRFGKE
ncbi:MAG: hypothetical protein WA103_01205 [Minisyncoccales bacterium]